MDDSIFKDIEQFLSSQSKEIRDQNLIQSGVLLALLCMRNVTTRTPGIEIRASDRDARRLMAYLVEPGIAPGLATLEERPGRNPPSWIIRPNWERLAALFGRTVPEMDRLLRDQFPRVLKRHRLTFQYMLADG